MNNRRLNAKSKLTPTSKYFLLNDKDIFVDDPFYLATVIAICFSIKYTKGQREPLSIQELLRCSKASEIKPDQEAIDEAVISRRYLNLERDIRKRIIFSMRNFTGAAYWLREESGDCPCPVVCRYFSSIDHSDRITDYIDSRN